jgi:hypothetical protein
MTTTVKRKMLRRLTGLTFWVWSVGAAVVCAYLLAGHLLAMPTPVRAARNGVLSNALTELRKPGPRGRLAVHVLLGSCGCSKRVLAHLVDRGVAAGYDEHVMIVDATEQQASDAVRLRLRGFVVTKVSSDELATRYSIESAPLLVVLDATDGVAYLGGYGDRKQAIDLRDVEILDRIRERTPVAALPTFGCAVSARLRRAIDPLGLRN